MFIHSIRQENKYKGEKVHTIFRPLDTIAYFMAIVLIPTTKHKFNNNGIYFSSNDIVVMFSSVSLNGE